ncbi:hypothetical protein Tco_0489580 [Tanacetum coccineum]
MSWLVFPSGYREVEVRRGDLYFNVNLHQMKYVCNMWQLSGIPCVHDMVGYMHMNMNPDLGVDEWYSQNAFIIALVGLKQRIPTPFGSSTIPPPSTPSGYNTMSPPPTPSSSNTMPSHATPGLNTSAGSNTMLSHAIFALT